MYKNKEKNNVIIVIGGGSFQGKSLIALNVAHRFSIPHIVCTDDIRNFLHIIYPKSVFYSSSTYLMNHKNLEKQMKKVSDVIEKLLYIYDKRGEDVIIEGMHLSRDFINYVTSKSNAICFCLNNNLPFNDRLKYKSLTRNRVEYLDEITYQIKYGKITEKNMNFTPYMKYSKRINEIHIDIVKNFLNSNSYLIEFVDISNATEKIINIIYNQ